MGLLAIGIGIAELGRALNGWKLPNERTGLNFLNDEYYPGDINFDPLGLKPEDPAEFAEMATKEIQNGRVAMLAIAVSSRRSSWTASPSSSTTSASKASMHFHHP